MSMHEAAVSTVMSPSVVWLHVDHPLGEAAKRMKEADIGLLFVLDGDEVVGTVTDRDIVIRGLAERLDLSIATVGDVMTRHVVHCSPGTSLADAAAVMAKERVRRLAVIDADRELAGVVALADLTRSSDEHGFIAEALREIVRPLETAKMPGYEDPTGGRARRSEPGTLHVYAERPRLRRRTR